MRNDRECVPTPQEMGKKIIPLTQSQKLQIEAIFDFVAAFFINMRLAQAEAALNGIKSEKQTEKA